MFIPVCNTNLTAKLCSRLSIHVNKKAQGLGRQFTFVIITARKRSLGQGNICAPVCHSVHRGKGLPRCMLGYTPHEQTPPGADTSPSGSACWEIRATSGRYVSYWNVILLFCYFSSTQSLSLHSTTLYDIRNGVMILVLRPESPSGTISLVITARNEVGARLYFHRRLSFCPWGGGIPACLAGGVPACLARGCVLSQHALQVVSQHALQQGGAYSQGGLLQGGT